MHEVVIEQAGSAGLITLARPRALNALSLDMIRDLTAALLRWRDDDSVAIVAIRGSSRHPTDASAHLPFGCFCAGGDIRFFHQAALAGDPALEDFFTEEYRLNHLIHHYGKPLVAFMDGIVMGGGMGVAQGARLRIATERTKMAMPETGIGLFPDVGGGYFLSRCPGHVGEYLALTGLVIDGKQALAAGLADHVVPSAQLPTLWAGLADGSLADAAALARHCVDSGVRTGAAPGWPDAGVDRIFGLPDLASMLQALQASASAGDAWAAHTASVLAGRSPLMLHVTLEQLRRARAMDLAAELRMERDLVRRCFHPAHLGRRGTAVEVVEGIRALAVDKDHHPRWNPARLDAVRPEMVAPFFDSPWPAHAHPLRDLA
ncbi:MAG: enoyl-CoA hydratase/isomerase family protein [Rhodoferax sp.]|jgi:enoyl-CoA hydratase|nr:enoyl-CoA hydratase/isomerase family protein [Rhodoferax sp.]